MCHPVYEILSVAQKSISRNQIRVQDSGVGNLVQTLKGVPFWPLKRPLEHSSLKVHWKGFLGDFLNLMLGVHDIG